MWLLEGCPQQTVAPRLREFPHPSYRLWYIRLLVINSRKPTWVKFLLRSILESGLYHMAKCSSTEQSFQPIEKQNVRLELDI